MFTDRLQEMWCRTRRRKSVAMEKFSQGLFRIFIFCGIVCPCFVEVTKVSSQQYFLATPQNTVAVEGSTVDLQCVVGALAGRVQWAKDGFLLGYDPKIPGYLRYGMVVDASRGLYNLRIHKIQMDDEAEYQCQVGPALNNQAIRAEARVSVIAPPRVLEIRGHRNGSTVELREGQKLALECAARNSKPLTKLKWMRNGIEITKDVVSMKEQESASNLKTTSTSITLSPKLDDNGAIYSCVGEHPAVSRPIRTNVFLSVFFAPGVPEIHGYKENEIVHAGDKLNLACISRGGNPMAKLVWFRNGDQVDVTYSTTGREATNTHSFTVGPKDNRAVYRCEASNAVTLQPLVASVRLNVNFAPTKVVIGGPRQVRAGDSVTLSCQTGSSNPPVEVSWVVDGSPRMATQAVIEDSSGGWVTSSNVTISVSRQDPDSKTFSCYAVSEALGETIVQTATVSVIYPPSPPTISGYDSSKPLKSGDVQKLTCVSNGGNPFASIKWFKNDKELRGIEKSLSTGTSSELAVRVEASDNGALYRCEAMNTALGKPLLTTITLSVLFPPASVSIKMKPRKPKAGTEVTLTCETGSSSPEASVQWWREGESMAGSHDGVSDAEFGGKSTRSKVRINVTSADDATTFTCQATNHALRRMVHETYTIRVLYKPEFLVNPADRFDVMEGESTVVNASARANPTQVTYSWTRNGLPLMDVSEVHDPRYKGHRAVYRGPLLELTDVAREDGGEYGCEAGNTEGVTWTTVNINVIYPARITKLTNVTTAGSGESAEFECEASANPVISRMITWRRSGFEMFRTQETAERGRSVLIVLNVSRTDAGEFECVAFNGIGQEAVRSTRLIVKFKPEVRIPAGFLDVAGSEGDEACSLVCLADGAPDVSFTWSFNGAVIGDHFNSAKYSSTALRIEHGGTRWQSVLTVKNVHAGDFGYYTCVARNELGHDLVKVRLRRRGPPDAPYNIRIVNTSAESVVLSWTPGFSSGLPQQFRIRYQQTGDQDLETQYMDVFPHNVTVFIVPGLQPDTEYIFSMSARNMLGESAYSKENTRALTQKWRSGPTGASSLDALNEGSGELPRLLLVIVSILGSLLLILNVVLVVCFIKRRKSRSQGNSSPKTQTTPESLMYTPSKYQQTINGEAICQDGAYQEEILMKELYEAKKQVNEKCIPGFPAATQPYDVAQTRRKDNCPDILKNRGMDHVSLQSVPLTLSSSDVITTLSDDSRYARRVLLPDDSSLCSTRQTDSPPPGSCVVGTVGSHLV